MNQAIRSTSNTVRMTPEMVSMNPTGLDGFSKVSNRPQFTRLSPQLNIQHWGGLERSTQYTNFSSPKQYSYPFSNGRSSNIGF